jgi:hypothetical protein
MKWNRDESNWTELKGRAKRQLYGSQDNGCDVTSSYANKHGNNEKPEINYNQHKAAIHMPHLYGLKNHISSSESFNEASTNYPTTKNMDRL